MHYKIQTLVSKEFTHAIDCLGQNMYKSSKKYHFLEQISSAQMLSPSQPQWRALPTFADWSQDDLEL